MHPPTARTTDMMYCRLCTEDLSHENNNKKQTFHLHAVLLPFFPIERASKILPGQVCHLAYLPG